MAAVQFRKLEEDENGIGKVHIGLSDQTFTVDDAIEHCGFGLFQIWVSIFSGLIWMVFAMEVMLLSILAPEIRCDFNLTDWQEALITTIFFCGMLFGSILWGKVLDNWGRKLGLFLSEIWVCYFSMLSAFAHSYVWLLVLRFLIGFGLSASPQVVTYYAEFLPVKSRAYCLVLVEVFFNIGLILEVVLAIIVMPRLNWRWLLGLTAIPLFIDLFTFKFAPESPRYYVAARQLDKARRVLEKVAKINDKPLPAGRLVSDQDRKTFETVQGSYSSTGSIAHANDDSTDSDVIKAEDSHIETTIVSETEQLLTSNDESKINQVYHSDHGSIFGLFSSKQLGGSTILLLFIWFGMSCTYYGVTFLTTEMLAIVKERSNDSTVVPCIEYAPVDDTHCARLEQNDYLTVMWTTAAESPGVIITALIIERIGRKKTMAVELAVCAAMFLLMLICPIKMTVFMVFVFITRALATGAFQAVYVYTPEIFPTSVRGLGLGCCSGAARLGAITTPFIAQVLLRVSMDGAKGTYAAISLLCSVFALLLPIETKGRIMKEQVDQ
ncbi:synaptic vesicle 2-related protein-like isoform X2 [Corticium candelabrum]|uniref:synaptic vesicle 2-related protein-like isoform X2 n=1 Tax=Corticium candelabrum TaxID=121492 RepID=UPI002E256EC9|nr:synaptic vesicle 2-related protein-like isoform X2 [Corticium candelabrum]